MYTRIKTPTEIEAMQESGQMLATILNALTSLDVVGYSTQDLANIAKAELKKLGGEAPFLGYQGFPDVICISLNDEVVHGIPSVERIIKTGDILSLDFGVKYRGMITDAATSIIVGNSLNPAYTKLLKITKESLEAGVKQVKNGVRVGDIGSAIEKVLSKANLGIVRDLVGHGVGHQLHEDPNIPNYGRAGRGDELQAGMTIAIEPMATLGDERVAISRDHWTIVTLDHSMSAHFEHTVLILEDGYKVLTKLDNKK